MIAPVAESWPIYQFRPTPEQQQRRFHEVLYEIHGRSLNLVRRGKFLIVNSKCGKIKGGDL